MNRFLRSAVLFVSIAAAFVFGGDILTDDFMSQSVSGGKWINNLSSEMMSVSVDGGAVAINNTSVYGGEWYHPFDGIKPSVFTISFVMKSVSSNGQAGVFFCRSEGFNGYLLTVNQENGYLMVLKYVGGAGSTVGGYYRQSSALNATDNKLTVSKYGSTFNLFVNEVYQGSFTDNQFNSGDVSFFVPGKTAASFGAFTMTDVFQSAPREFSDNFDGASMKKEWKFLGTDVKPTQVGGKLSSASNAEMKMYVDMELNDFSAGVEVKHIAGSDTKLYGIVLIGEPDTYYPEVCFWIQRNRRYSVYNTETDEINASIKGPSLTISDGGVDTIEVKKVKDASTYQFIVNGTPLIVDHAVANFKIIGIGLICQSGQTVEFDNFHVQKEGDITSVKWNIGDRKVSQKTLTIRQNNSVYYDLRGRKSRAAVNISSGRTRGAAGIYVNENNREVLIGKRR